MAKVAFIGLGVMGFPMAGHLKTKGGHDVTVYNRTAEKAAAWAEKFSGKSASTPAEAAAGADFVFVCVGNDEDLRSVTLGENGALHGMKPGSVLIDNTTASAEVARELYAAAKEKGVDFIDAPVSGGQVGAENGVLTVMCGGDEAVFERARPVIDAYARMVGLMGPAGSGQLTKMVNQICILKPRPGTCRSAAFRQACWPRYRKGGRGDLQGQWLWQMENRHKTMNAGKYDFGFAVDWMRKDLGIVLTEARRNGAKLPVTAVVDQFYGDVQAMGGNRWDTSSLLARLEK